MTSAYETARQMQRRVFYEAATETLRTAPANYLIASRRNGRWVVDLDGALITAGFTVMPIQQLLNTWQNGSTGAALAEVLERSFDWAL